MFYSLCKIYKKEKVYCGKCKHYSLSLDNKDVCCNPNAQKIKHTPIKKEIENQDCFVLNKDNDCFYFERKR